MREPVKELQLVEFRPVEPASNLADDEIGLQSKMYAKLFEDPFSGRDQSRPSRRGIVRVETENSGKGKRTVYLLFRGHTQSGFTIENCVLSVSARHRLGLSGRQGGIVSVSPTGRIVGRFMFLWTHPNHLMRAGYKLAIVAMIVTVVIGLVSVL